MNYKFVALFAILVLASATVTNVYASTWGGQPFEGLYPRGDTTNNSYPLDWNKFRDSQHTKAYGWASSKVCGLKLCSGEDRSDQSEPFLQNQHLASAGGIFSHLNDFDGKFYIKGNFRR